MTSTTPLHTHTIPVVQVTNVIPASITTRIAVSSISHSASQALILMEACRTIPSELRMYRRALKRGRLNAAEILFLTVKYFAIIAYTLDAVLRWTPFPNSARQCAGITWTSQIFMFSCTSLVAVAVAWRAHIIFHRSKMSFSILSLLLMGQIAVTTASMVAQLKWSEYRNGYCQIDFRGMTTEQYLAKKWYTLISPWNVFYNSMFDLVIAIATSMRLIRTTQGLNGLTRISKLLFYNNVHYVLIVCSANFFDFFVIATYRNRWPKILELVFALQICAILNMLSSEQDAVHTGGSSIPKLIRNPPSGVFAKGRHSVGNEKATTSATESDRPPRFSALPHASRDSRFLRSTFGFLTSALRKHHNEHRQQQEKARNSTLSEQANRSSTSKDSLGADGTLESVTVVPTLLHSSRSFNERKLMPSSYGFKVESETLVDGYQSPLSADTLCQKEQEQHYSWLLPTPTTSPCKGQITVAVEEPVAHLRHHPHDLDLVAVGNPEDGMVYYTYSDDTSDASPRDLEQANFLRNKAQQSPLSSSTSSPNASPSKGTSIREIRRQLLQQQSIKQEEGLKAAHEMRRKIFDQRSNNLCELKDIRRPASSPQEQQREKDVDSEHGDARCSSTTPPSTPTGRKTTCNQNSPDFDLWPGDFHRRKPKTAPGYTSSPSSSTSSSPSKMFRTEQTRQDFGDSNLTCQSPLSEQSMDSPIDTALFAFSLKQEKQAPRPTSSLSSSSSAMLRTPIRMPSAPPRSVGNGAWGGTRMHQLPSKNDKQPKWM